MTRDSINTDVRQLSGERNGPGPKPSNKDLNAGEEREQIPGMIKQSGDTTDEAEAETGKFTTGLTPHQVVKELISVRTQLEAAEEHHAQSAGVSRYAAVDSVRREDPW